MEVRQLRYFLAVADAGSISEAARRLGVSQPTVSDRIHLLEDRIHTNLFERQPRGMRLTCAGREMLRLARRIVSDVDLALSFTERAARVEVGSLSIGFHTSLADGPLRETLEAFRRTAPEVALELHEGNPPDLQARLRDREIELVVMVHEISGGIFEIQALWDEALIVALPIDHPLAQRASLVWADLWDQRIVLRGCRSGGAPYKFLPGRVELDGSVAVERHYISREALLGLVGIGAGITVMGRSALGLEMPNVVLKPLTGPDSSLPVVAVWLPGNDNPARGRFVAMLRDWQPNAAQSLSA